MVRGCLGLGDLCAHYELDAGNTSGNYADFRTHYSGWEVTIRFYDAFYKCPFEKQLEIIIHEHLHGVLHPLDQMTMRVERYLPGKRRKQCTELLVVGREMTVEHFTKPLLDLLMPQIQQVL